MKRAVLLFALLSLLACGQRETTSSAPAETTAPRAAARPFRVGLLTPGSINDGGWNALAWEGVQRIQKELGAEISHQETKTPAEMTEGFRAFGQKGFDLAFGHGFEYQEPAKTAGAQFPGTIYITTSGSTIAANVAPMRFQIEEATYLLGIIAARESKTGKAGLVGGINVQSKDQHVQRALLEMSTTAQINDSLKLGTVLLGEIGNVGKLHKPRVEQAGFAVLKAPDIPSVLVETAFISNPEEEKRLRSSAYQEQLADALMRGITRYFAKNPPLARSRSV